MNYIRCPAQFLNSFHYSPYKEDGTFVIVAVFITIVVGNSVFAVKKVFVVDELNLQACGLYRCNFNNQWMIGIVDNQVHS